MTDAIFRQWTMFQHIPREPQRISTTDLQKRLADADFRIDIRGLQRDLNALSTLFPLVCDTRSKPYGWSWRKDGQGLTIPGMSPHTALAMKLIQSSLSPLLPPETLRTLKPQFEAADRILKGLSASALRGWSQKVRTLPPGQRLLPPSMHVDTFYIAQEALLTNRRFAATYLPRERDAKKPDVYEVSPLGLVLRSSVVYLVCTIFDYEDVRQLAMHRLSGGKLLDTPVVIPEGFDLDEYIASKGFDFPLGRKIRLQLVMDADAAFHLRETKLSEDQTITDLSGNKVRLRATVMDTSQLRWWLLGFGAQLEVEKPAALRNELKKIIVDMNVLYAGKG